MKKLGLAVLAGVVLSAGIVVLAAPKSDAEVIREMRDRIERLRWSRGKSAARRWR